MSLVSASLKGLGIVVLVVVGLSIRATPPTTQKAVPVSVPQGNAVTASSDGIPLANAHAAAVTQPSAPDAWGGTRTGKDRRAHV